MKHSNVLIISVLIIFSIIAFSAFLPNTRKQLQAERIQDVYQDMYIENVTEIIQMPIAYQMPYDPVITRVPDVIHFDPEDILLYIKEQCHLVGVNYNFAVSLLLEENARFLRLVNGLVSQESVFEVLNHNDNGSIDYGLWQLNGNFLWKDFVPMHWHNLSDFHWKNPYHSTYVAIRHIKWLYTSIQKFHNDRGTPQMVNSLYWETAMAYNAGLDRIRSGNAPSEKTMDYAARILERAFF